MPREVFGPGDPDFPQISAPARPPSPLSTLQWKHSQTFWGGTTHMYALKMLYPVEGPEVERAGPPMRTPPPPGTAEDAECARQLHLELNAPPPRRGLNLTP